MELIQVSIQLTLAIIILMLIIISVSLYCHHSGLHIKFEVDDLEVSIALNAIAHTRIIMAHILSQMAHTILSQ